MRSRDLLQTSQGGRAVVAKIEDEMVTVDLNHPLASKELTFNVELVMQPAPAGRRNTDPRRR